MIYLASPYYHADPLIMKTRFLLAKQATRALLEQRIWTYSPILHNHPLKLERSHEFWMSFDLDMLRRCDAMLILQIPGWDVSKGVGIEIEACRVMQMKMSFVNEEGQFLGAYN